MAGGRASTARIAKRIGISLVSVVVAFLLAEVGNRLWLRWRGTPYDSDLAAANMRLRLDTIRAFVPGIGARRAVSVDGGVLGILHPYFGSESVHDSGGVLEHFRAGVPPEEYTILVVGGSVAVNFADTMGDELARLVGEDPSLAGRRVVVLDYAHAAFKQPQPLMRVAWLLSLGYRPDAVIALDGFNEVALGWENGETGTHPVYPGYSLWGALVQDLGALDPEALDLTMELWRLRNHARALVDRSLDWKLYRSSLWGRFALSRIYRLNEERGRVQARLDRRSVEFDAGPVMRRQIRGPDYARDPGKVLDQCVTDWAESSLSLHAICASRGILYVHALQPTLRDEGSKPLTPGESGVPAPSRGWSEGPRLGYPRMRERGRELAQQGVRFLDLSHVFVDVAETIYVDVCHVNEKGNRRLADAIARGFREFLAR